MKRKGYSILSLLLVVVMVITLVQDIKVNASTKDTEGDYLDGYLTSSSMNAVNQAKSGLGTTETITAVNQTSKLMFHNYQYGSKYYETTITSVKVENPALVEVVDQYRENRFIEGSEYAEYSDEAQMWEGTRPTDYYMVELKGKQTGTTKLTINYTYVSSNGSIKTASESANVIILDGFYIGYLKCSEDEVAPGGSAQYSVDVYKSICDNNGNYHTETANDYEVRYESRLGGLLDEYQEAKDYKWSLDTNGLLTVAPDSATGLGIRVYATIFVNGHDVKASGELEIYMSDTLQYRIKGLPEDTLELDIGDTYEINPELYRYDKEHPNGVKVTDTTNISYEWLLESYDGGPNRGTSLSTDEITATGKTITAKKAGAGEISVVAMINGYGTVKVSNPIIYKIEEDQMQQLPVDSTTPVTKDFNTYHRFVASENGTHRFEMLSVSEGYCNEGIFTLYDKDWNKVEGYNIQQSYNYILKQGETYYVKSRRSGDSGSTPGYNLKVTGPSNLTVLSESDVSLSSSRVTYNNTTPQVTVKHGGVVLKEGQDYIVLTDNEYYEAICPGRYNLKIYGIGKYAGNFDRHFIIEPDTITASMVTLDKIGTNATGSKQLPKVVVKCDGREIYDYNVYYSGNMTDVGVYTVTIAGTEEYAGVVKKTFTIKKATPKLTFKKTTLKKATGDSAFTNTLSSSKKNPVKYSSSNTKVATVSSKGKVSITGVGTTTIKVVMPETKSTYQATASYKLTVTKGHNTIVASSVSKTASSKARSFKLNASTTFKTTLSYSSNNKSVKVKNGVVTIAKNFVGKATITITAKSKSSCYGTKKKITITVKPAGTSLKSVSNIISRKLKIKWNKQSKATGYEIQYSTSSKFKSAKKIYVKKSSTTSYTKSKLTKGKTYYVRIRTYKSTKGVKYYSSWSKVIKKKVSK